MEDEGSKSSATNISNLISLGLFLSVLGVFLIFLWQVGKENPFECFLNLKSSKILIYVNL